MLSTFANRAIYSRFSLILYLSIALSLRATTCQSTENEQTIVEATDTTFIFYQPALDDTRQLWDVDPSKPQMPVVSTEHHNATAHFQFKGTSVSLLADLSKFTADKMFVIVDSHERSMNISTLDKLPDQDGLFAFFSEDNFSGTDLHTILVGLDPKGQGSWNLVAVKYTPSNSPSAASQTFTPTAATEGTQTSTPVAAVDRHNNNSGKIAGAVIGTLLGLIIVALISFYLHRRRLARKRVLVADPLVIEKSKAGPRSHQTNRSFLQRMNSRRLPRFVAPPSVWPSSRSSSEYNELPHSADHRRRNHHQEPRPPLGAEKAVSPNPKHASCPQGGFIVTNPSLNPSNASSGGDIVRSATAPPAAAYLSRPLARIAGSTTSSVPTEKWLKERKAVAKGKTRAMPDSSVAHPKPRMSRARSLRTFFTTNPSPSTYSSSTTSSKRSKELKTQPEVPHQKMEQTTLPTALPIAATTLKVEGSQTPKRTASPSGRSRESRTVFFTTNPSPPSVPDPADTAIVDLITSDNPRPRIDKGKGRAL